MGKSIPKTWAISERFNALLKVNNHLLGENSLNLVTLKGMYITEVKIANFYCNFLAKLEKSITLVPCFT
jgi:hypothetical protein